MPTRLDFLPPSAPPEQAERFGTLIASEEIRPLQAIPSPGDIIGFSGTSNLSACINLATFGWPGVGLAHVGIVAQTHGRKLLLVESTAIAREPCIIHRHHVRGAQAHDLVDVLRRPGRIYHYPLADPLSAAESESLRNYLVDLVRADHPYDYVGALRARFTPLALLRRWKYGREDLNTLFCSELAAAGLRHVGRLRLRNVSALSPNELCRYLVHAGITSPALRLK